jgi:hypothetical protein
MHELYSVSRNSLNLGSKNIFFNNPAITERSAAEWAVQVLPAQQVRGSKLAQASGCTAHGTVFRGFKSVRESVGLEL